MAPDPKPPPGLTVTDDAFLGGRLRIWQPETGFRAGLDSVLLAAAAEPAKGARVLELGTGPGVAACCLAWRRPDVTLTGLEIDPQVASLAAANAVRNGLGERLIVETGDVADPPAALRSGDFGHVMLNPPFTPAGEGTAPPDPAKARAHQDSPGLSLWLDRALRSLRPGGGLTLIHRTEALAEALSALQGRAGAVEVIPLWPGPDSAGRPRAARRVLIRAVKGARTPLTLTPGRDLHALGGALSPWVQAMTRGGAGFEAAQPGIPAHKGHSPLG